MVFEWSAFFTVLRWRCISLHALDLYGENTYRFCNLRKRKDFNNKKKNSLPYINCVLLFSCVVHGPIYGRFMGFLDMVELCRPVLRILSLTKILFFTPIFSGLFQTSRYRRAKLARLQHDTSTTWFQTSNLIQSNGTAVAENKTHQKRNSLANC